MEEHTKRLVKESWAYVVPTLEQAAELFYGRLFELEPGLRLLFKSSMPQQGRLLMKALDEAVSQLDSPETLIPVVRALGRRHAHYGVVAADYDAVGAALLWTLEQGLSEGFTDDVRAAWTEVYEVLATVMKEAQDEVQISGPVSPRTRRLVQGSWRLVVPISDAAAEIFYRKLFELDPGLKPLFKGDMKAQGKKLMQMLAIAVNGLNKIEAIVPAVQTLGRRHVDYGVKEQHYDTVATALLAALEKGLGHTFTAEVESAWVTVYTLLANTMKAAAAEVSSEETRDEGELAPGTAGLGAAQLG